MIAVPFLIVFASDAARKLIESTRARDARSGRNILLAGARSRGRDSCSRSASRSRSPRPRGCLAASTLQALNALDADSLAGFTGGLGVMLLGAAAAMIPRPQRHALARLDRARRSAS